MWNRYGGRGSQSWRRLCSVALAVALAVSPLSGCRSSSDRKSGVTYAPDTSVVLVAPSAAGGAASSIAGTVTHEGAPLPGTTITISSPALQGTRVAVSNVNGDYAFRSVPPGAYTISFEMEGMSRVVKTAEVRAGYVARVPATIQLSSVAEMITVTAAALRFSKRPR